MNYRFTKKLFLKEFFLYGLIGIMSASIDSGVFIILTNININIYIANFIGVNLGIFISFILNTFINFKTTDKIFKRALSFFKIGYIGMVISMIIMYLGNDVFNIDEIKVKITSIFIVALFQFIMNKLFTFKEI